MSLVSRKSLKKVRAHEPMWVLTSLCELLWAYMSSYEPMCFIRWAFWARRASKKWVIMSSHEPMWVLMSLIWACVSWYRILTESGAKTSRIGAKIRRMCAKTRRMGASLVTNSIFQCFSSFFRIHLYRIMKESFLRNTIVQKLYPENWCQISRHRMF